MAMEGARAGRSYADASRRRGVVGRGQLLPGVAELLEQPLQVEAAFGDGSRLVALEGWCSS